MTAPRTDTRRRPRKPKTVRSPTVLQMENVECGAAALAMVLGHHGRHVQLEELRIACGVSRNGTLAANILRAARSYGLHAKGMQMESAELVDVPAPSIVFWEFNHFVVFEGIGRRFGRPVVHINDPARGRRIVTPEEFDAGFTGIVLTFEPGEEFEPNGRRPSVLSVLPARLRGVTGTLVAALVASLMLIALGAITPAFTRAFIDMFLFGSDTSGLLPFFALMTVTIVLMMLLTVRQQRYLLSSRVVSSILTSVSFLRHLLRLPVVFFSQRSPADLTQRLQSNDTVADMLAWDLVNAGVDAMVIVLYAVLLWSYDPQLTLVGVFIALLNLVALRLVMRVRHNRIHRLRADTARLLSTSYNGLQLIETMKATGRETQYFRQWAGHQAAVLRGQQGIGVPSAALAVIAPTLATFSSALILLIGGLRAVDGYISIGLLVAFQTLVTSFTRPITKLTSMAGRIQDFTVDVARLRDVECFPADPIYTRPESPDHRRLTGHLALDRITFGYDTLGKPLLVDFSLSVGPGKQVAIVGGSGSGKSTVTRLISGLHRPWSGEIRIDGQLLDETSRSSLAASVAFVDQDIFLFEGSVRENITLWDPSISDEAVVVALKDAGMYDVVSARPGGIHGPVAQDGRNFSGGQRQRLEIARALVRQPSVLVLDEATSALDAEAERVISDNLRKRGCACVVIAHRLSTVRDSDEIVVLDRGTVVERGTHEDMVAAGGPYADLVKES